MIRCWIVCGYQVLEPQQERSIRSFSFFLFSSSLHYLFIESELRFFTFHPRNDGKTEIVEYDERNEGYIDPDIQIQTVFSNEEDDPNNICQQTNSKGSTRDDIRLHRCPVGMQ